MDVQLREDENEALEQVRVMIAGCGAEVKETSATSGEVVAITGSGITGSTIQALMSLRFIDAEDGHDMALARGGFQSIIGGLRITFR